MLLFTILLQVRQSLNCLYRVTGVPSVYFSPGSRGRTTGLINDSDDSDDGSEFEDITMVTISLEHPGASLNFTKGGLYFVCAMNGVVCTVLAVCIGMT